MAGSPGKVAELGTGGLNTSRFARTNYVQFGPGAACSKPEPGPGGRLELSTPGAPGSKSGSPSGCGFPKFDVCAADSVTRCLCPRCRRSRCSRRSQALAAIQDPRRGGRWDRHRDIPPTACSRRPSSDRNSMGQAIASRGSFCHLLCKIDRPPRSEGFPFKGVAHFLTKGGKKIPLCAFRAILASSRARMVPFTVSSS